MSHTFQNVNGRVSLGKLDKCPIVIGIDGNEIQDPYSNVLAEKNRFLTLDSRYRRGIRQKRYDD